MPKRIDPIDKIVGNKIRIFRLANGFSQEHVAKSLGVSFQQVQKYEYGTNRIGPGRLAKLAKLLDVPVNQFFDGVPNERDEKVGVVTELLANPYAIRMLRALNRISDRGTILSVVELAESIAEARS